MSRAVAESVDCSFVEGSPATEVAMMILLATILGVCWWVIGSNPSLPNRSAAGRDPDEFIFTSVAAGKRRVPRRLLGSEVEDVPDDEDLEDGREI